ncbi:MAG: 50S ribosomal protein L9 [Candidatus Omnitrophota bacterium]|nr:MAG: 50S ribosomal protein L9 [Candidatus Omnitrophota bacterium]
MKVILKESIRNVGEIGDTVELAAGYARNYLIPQGKALQANKQNLKIFEQYKKSLQKKAEQIKRKAEDIAKKISKVSCTVVMQANEEQLYGTVTSADIAAALEQEGISIDKKDIVIEELIKTLGVYHIPIKLHPEVKAQVKVWVVKK